MRSPSRVENDPDITETTTTAEPDRRRWRALALVCVAAQQIGGAIGVAIAATVAFTHTKTLLASGHSPAQAATSGYALGFWVIAGVSAVALVACIALLNVLELEQTAPAVAV